MLIQCHIVREGSTFISKERFNYEFRPRPEITNGDTEAKVCEVTSGSHQAHFLSFPSDFSRYYRLGEQRIEPGEAKNSADSAAGPLFDRETALLRREEALNERDSSLNNKECDLRDREERIIKGEQVLDEREAELDAKEKAGSDTSNMEIEALKNESRRNKDGHK
jgi:hypothetical protein